MVAKIIQAVAGAGKTYHITHNLGNNKRCLYLTYTNGNVMNLKRELYLSEKNPSQYLVSTFSKFVIDWFVRPFLDLLKPGRFSFRGFSTVKPTSDSRMPGYVKKGEVGHYIDEHGRLYLNRISELIASQSKELLEMMFNRLARFVDEVIVDEYQDFTGYDFNLIKKVVKQKYFNVILVGDIFQAGVVNSLSNGKRDKKIANYDFTEGVDVFLKKIFGSSKLDVDATSLASSRRISKDCADFVTSKLDIPIQSQEISKGKLHNIRNSTELRTLVNESGQLDILIYDNRVKHVFDNQKYVTWTYSKGDTYDNVLVVLAGVTDFLITGKKPKKALSSETKNKLYVALTRARGELYIVSSKIWRETGS
ncbi:AAA family ATPase [Lentilactobacillus hilgardii]|nr:AAA family ATPase [Lentilactobacillus hilgardii]MCV3739872.1 AAA family ATPase [Lentilactobacillus hilgardii]